MDPKLLLDPALIPKWIGYWATFYVVSFLFLKKANYEKLVESMKKLLNRMPKSALDPAIENAEMMARTLEKPTLVNPVEIRMCQALFR